MSTHEAFLPRSLGLHCPCQDLHCLRQDQHGLYMNNTLELIRALLRWSLHTVELAESRGSSIPAPKLAEFQLGRLVHRGQLETALAIAEDVAGVTWDSGDDPTKILDALGDILAAARSSDRPTRTTRRGPSHQAYWIAVELVRRMRVGRTPEQRRLLEQGARCRSWKQLATDHWPGRDWASLRDDYARLAEMIWRQEKIFLSHAAEIVVKESTIEKAAS